MSYLKDYVFKMFRWKLFLTAIEFYLKCSYLQRYKCIVIYLAENEYILSQDTNVLWFTWPKWIYTIRRYKCILTYVSKNEYILLYSSKKKSHLSYKKKHILCVTHFWLPSQYNIVGGSNISHLAMRLKAINYHCILLSFLHHGLSLVSDSHHDLSVCNNSHPLLQSHL